MQSTAPLQNLLSVWRGNNWTSLKPAAAGMSALRGVAFEPELSRLVRLFVSVAVGPMWFEDFQNHRREVHDERC